MSSIEEEFRRAKELFEGLGRDDSPADYAYYLVMIKSFVEEFGAFQLYVDVRQTAERMIKEGERLDNVVKWLRGVLQYLEENYRFVTEGAVTSLEDIEKLKKHRGEVAIKDAKVLVERNRERLRIVVKNQTPFNAVVREVTLGDSAWLAVPLGFVSIRPGDEILIERRVITSREPDTVTLRFLLAGSEFEIKSSVKVRRVEVVSYKDLLWRGVEILKKVEPLSISRLTTYKKLGDWHVVGFIGSGGFGDVYLVKRGEELAAAKVARRGLESVIRREWEVLKQIHRSIPREAASHVVEVLDYGEKYEKGAAVPYIVLKFYRRGNLARLAQTSGGVSPRDALAAVLQVGGTLLEVYKEGILKKHGDLKPENILIDDEGKPVISDFGTALAVERYTIRDQPTTVGYGCSAEDSRADVYALARVLTDLLVGIHKGEEDTPQPVKQLILKARKRKGSDCDEKKIPKMEDFIKEAEELYSSI